MIVKILQISILAVLVFGDQVKYDNYALYKVYAENDDHVKFLHLLEGDKDFSQFWKKPSQVGDYASVVVPPANLDEFEHILRKRSIRSELMLENIQEAFDAQVTSRRKRAANQELLWTNYQTEEDIYNWFDFLGRNYNQIVTQITVGRTPEGRNITGIKITRGAGTRVFVLQAGEIGADWLSPSILTYIADQLIRSDNPEIRAAAEDFTWYIFPLLNLDGFQYTQDFVRLWTKNRRHILSRNTISIGADLSKNWNSHWGVSGGSYDRASNNYYGLGPFSEPETRAISDFIVNNIGTPITGFLNFRSFGQRIVIPFAHTDNLMYNYNDMVTIARRAAGSLSVKYSTQYLVGNSRSVHDGATGSAIDWVKYRFNPPIVASFLLRDAGFRGYTLPVTEILPSCEETLDGILAIIREARFIKIIH